MSLFICAQCGGGPWETGNTEARAEAAERFPYLDVDSDDAAIVCDDCYAVVTREPTFHACLLKKYMRHVATNEGTDFVLDGDGHGSDHRSFTDDEWTELQRIANAVIVE